MVSGTSRARTEVRKTLSYLGAGVDQMEMMDLAPGEPEFAYSSVRGARQGRFRAVVDTFTVDQIVNTPRNDLGEIACS